MSSDEITMSGVEYETAKAVAVHDKQLEILIDDFRNNKNDVLEKLTLLSAQQSEFMRTMPNQIAVCRQELETELKEHIKNEYVTRDEIKSMKVQVISWIAGCSFTIFAFQWILTKTNLLGA